MKDQPLKLFSSNALRQLHFRHDAGETAGMQQQDLNVFNKILAAIEDHESNACSNETTITCDLLFRNNPDGSPRWIWPADLSQPVFLKFYNASSRRAKMLAWLIRTAFKFRLQRFFASGKMKVQFAKKDLTAFTAITGSSWSLFTGTAGVNRTVLFYGNEHFYKIGVGKDAAHLIRHEYRNISRLQENNFSAIEMPAASYDNGVLQLKDIAGNSKRVNELTPLHWKALAELAEQDKCSAPVSTLHAWQEFENKIQAIINRNDSRIPKGIISKLQQLKATIDSSTVIPASCSHGDFTPWNMFVQNDRLSLIDWELSRTTMPCFFDAFHFLYQQASLVDHCSYETLSARITAAIKSPEAAALISSKKADINLHHRLYLLFNTVYYLDIYSKQQVWHPQVQMSLDCWNNALNEMLVKAGCLSKRQAVLSDLFDFLRDKKYAAVKWLNTSAASVPEDSDIDLCMEKTVCKQLGSFLKKHTYTAVCREKRKSFMSTFSVLLKGGSFLSIDAILQFKRRNLVMMDAAEMLAAAAPNGHGIKIPAVEHDFNYTWLFYLLNHASVPERYQKHFSFFSLAWRKKLNASFAWKEKLQVRNYTEVYDYNKENANIVRAELAAGRENRGWNKIKNSFYYLIDTLKENSFKKGFIITFSGVDGAGKSTVIENVRHQVEKKFRRKVVVLRHRPSLLPMISGLKEGRKASELRSASTMPRQGNNNSIISSLFRFAYYYTDYLFGQFVIQVKYVWRGYVVLYDRYYFDFINDGKRSNIVLPPAFTRLWYAFLLKPSFNFFLYADADTILQRKKEMDKKTIGILTGKYLQLFQQLGRRYHQSKYISIQNEVLPQTLETILFHVKKKVI